MQVTAAGDASPFFDTALWTKAMERACFQVFVCVRESVCVCVSV